MTVTIGGAASYGKDMQVTSLTTFGQGVRWLRNDAKTDAETTATDTVNLNADLSGVRASTASSQMTLGLAQLVQGATHVDPGTGVHELNQGISDKLSGQLTALLTGSGFSKDDAAAASQSLVQQLASSSSSTGALTLSLAGKSQSANGYDELVGGGRASHTWSAVSTTALSISLDRGTGSLAVHVDRHEIDMWSVSWSSREASDVSISSNQAELQAGSHQFALTNSAGTSTTADAGSPLQETLTTVVSEPSSEVGGGDTPPGATTAGAAASPLATGQTARSTPASTLSGVRVDTGAQAALRALTAIRQQGEAATRSIKLSLSTKVGDVRSGRDGGKVIAYDRPSGGWGVITLPSVNTRV
jgi:hypothetical protein